ncbi:hypothetical protein A3715_15515 [Oleiphilus sp. HI0009]|nr:hypothetical protein A3715_15515 [Oleiphilus sp. HI0009]
MKSIVSWELKRIFLMLIFKTFIKIIFLFFLYTAIFIKASFAFPTQDYKSFTLFTHPDISVPGYFIQLSSLFERHSIVYDSIDVLLAASPYLYGEDLTPQTEIQLNALEGKSRLVFHKNMELFKLHDYYHADLALVIKKDNSNNLYTCLRRSRKNTDLSLSLSGNAVYTLNGLLRLQDPKSLLNLNALSEPGCRSKNIVPLDSISSETKTTILRYLTTPDNMYWKKVTIRIYFSLLPPTFTNNLPNVLHYRFNANLDYIQIIAI